MSDLFVEKKGPGWNSGELAPANDEVEEAIRLFNLTNWSGIARVVACGKSNKTEADCGVYEYAIFVIPWIGKFYMNFARQYNRRRSRAQVGTHGGPAYAQGEIRPFQYEKGMEVEVQVKLVVDKFGRAKIRLSEVKGEMSWGTRPNPDGTVDDLIELLKENEIN